MRAVNIPTHVDRAFRRGLSELVAVNGGYSARWHIRKALEKGPSRGGYAEAARYFGNEFQAKLLLTVPIVEACEVSMPGFGKWLNDTGFGNDKTMIKGFVAWAEHAHQKGLVRTEIGDRAKNAAISRG